MRESPSALDVAKAIGNVIGKAQIKSEQGCLVALIPQHVSFAERRRYALMIEGLSK